MCNSEQGQSISEQGNLLNSYGLIRTPSKDENSYGTLKSDNDKKEEPLCRCDHCSKNRSNRKRFLKSVLTKRNKSSGLTKHSNDLDSSKYWLSGEEFFRTPSKKFNEPDESTKSNIFQYRPCLDSNHTKLDDTFLLPIREKSDDTESYMLKDVNKNSNRNDSDFLDHFELPFYRPESDSTDYNTKSKTKVSLKDSTREKKEEKEKDGNSNEILNWINDFERTRTRCYSNDLDRKTKENTSKSSSSSNFPFVTKDFDETIRTSPNKDVRKSNITEDSRCCISESLKEPKDVIKNIKKTDSKNQSNRWIIENISDIITSKETSSKLTNSIRVIPNTASIYNNIYLSSKYSEKFFNISKLIKLMRRCARVSRIRRRIFKGTNNRLKNRLSIIYKKDHSLFVNDSNNLKGNVCDILAGIKEELTDNLRAIKKLCEKLPNSNVIRSVSMPEVEDTLNEVITRCKNYIRDNNYCEKAVTKVNDLLTKSVNDLQKVMKVETLVHSKKTLRKSIEEQNYKHLKSIQGGQDFLKDDIKQALNGKKKMIDRKNKIKGLINDMLRLTNDIITVEDNKENIKKPVNRKTSILNNLQNKQSNNRLEIKMSRDKNVKSSTVKKINQMENEMNFVSQQFQAGSSSNVRKNKLVSFKKDKALKENQNRSEKPIVYHQQLQNVEKKKSARTISNISFGNNKEKVKNNPGSCLETAQAIKDKKNNEMCERKTRMSSSIYITDKHRDRSRKSDDIRFKRQIQPVWKPGGAVKSFASNPMFLNNESTNRRTWQNCLEKDNQEIKKSIVNPSEPTVTDRNNFFKEYRRNENFAEKRVTGICELLAETKTMQKELKDNSNLLSETRSSPYNRSEIPLSNTSLTKIRVNSTDLNPKKDKSEFKSRPGIPKLNPLKILFNDKRDNKSPVAHNFSKNNPTEDYKKKEEDKKICCSNERNDYRNSSMVLLEVPDKIPAIPSSVYKNQKTNEETTNNNIKEKSFIEKQNSSNEEITKIDDSLQKSTLKSNINFDRDTVIENQPSLISFRNMNCNIKANSMSNSITMVTSPKYCQLSCLSSLSSKTDFIFEQSTEKNKSNKIDKDSLENSTDDNDEENEFKLDELKDEIKEDFDRIEEKKKYQLSLNVSDISCSSIPYVLTKNFEDRSTKLQYSNIKKDISRDSLNKVSIDSKSSSDTDQEMKSMRVIERARFNDNKSIVRTVDETKCRSSQTISDSKSFSDAYTNVEDINSNSIKYVDRIVPSPNDIDWKISLKDVATEILLQDQSILLPTQMIQTQTNERSSTEKNVATDSFINSSKNRNETKTVVNVDSKSICVCEEKEVLDHNDRWVMETVELYCEQPNDDLPISTENHKEENNDCNDPNDRWVAETVDLYCEQPNYESDSKEDKNELNKSPESKINNNFNVERSMLSVSLIDQLKGIKEQLQSVDVKLNKLQETTKEANDVFSRINITTTPFDSNIKERTSSYDLSESSNIKNVMIDERRSSSTIESSLSSNSFNRSSRISKERRFERFNIDPDEMSDAFQMTSCYSKNLYDAIKIGKDGSIVNNQSNESKRSSSTSFEKSLGYFEKGSMKFDEQLTCEYFNKNCFRSYDNNNFNDDDEDMISIKSKSSSVEHIFYELRATDHSSSSDNESDKTESYVFLSTKNSNDMKEGETKTISDSIKKVSSNVLSIKDKRLEIMKYSDKETYFTFYNENIESNDYNDLIISREGLLLLIYFTVCFFVFFCLNFSIACEPWFIS